MFKILFFFFKLIRFLFKFLAGITFLIAAISGSIFLYDYQTRTKYDQNQDDHEDIDDAQQNEDKENI